MIWGFLFYLAKWALGLVAGAILLKSVAIGAEMVLERARR